jgi:hypothetical protein
MASHLPRLKDLDGLDTRFLAPAAGFALGQRTAPHPFSVAAGRDALGPELARRVRGEVDHDAVRVDVAHAAALVYFAGGIGGLELDPHDCSVMKWPAALTRNGSCRWLTWPAHELRRAAGNLVRFLVALPSVPDLLLWAKHLFVEAMSGNYSRRGGGEW